jgi:hypothetical protein
MGWDTGSFTPVEAELGASHILAFLTKVENVTSLEHFCREARFPAKRTLIAKDVFDFPGSSVSEPASNGPRPERPR